MPADGMLPPYRTPRRALGERERADMQVLPVFLESTAFVCVTDGGALVPSGTGFFVNVPDEENPAQSVDYFVTAAHVVKDRPSTRFAVRCNTLVGHLADSAGPGQKAYVDKESYGREWWFHKTADVAAVRMEDERDIQWAPIYRALPLRVFVGKDGVFRPSAEYWEDDVPRLAPTIGFEVVVGDPVFFAGLFVQSPGTLRNLPIARFGNVSRLPTEEEIVVETKRRIRAPFRHVYLAECHSWGGHSGSPVFWHREVRLPGTFDAPEYQDHGVPRRYVAALLGLVSAHFDIPIEADCKLGPLAVTTKGNSGIAIVTPAEAVRELLMSDEVRKDRHNLTIQRETARARRRVATADSGSSGAMTTQETKAGLTIPLPARQDVFSALTKATRKRTPARKPSRRGR